MSGSRTAAALWGGHTWQGVARGLPAVPPQSLCNTHPSFPPHPRSSSRVFAYSWLDSGPESPSLSSGPQVQRPPSLGLTPAEWSELGPGPTPSLTPPARFTYLSPFSPVDRIQGPAGLFIIPGLRETLSTACRGRGGRLGGRRGAHLERGLAVEVALACPHPFTVLHFCLSGCLSFGSCTSFSLF